MKKNMLLFLFMLLVFMSFSTVKALDSVLLNRNELISIEPDLDNHISYDLVSILENDDGYYVFEKSESCSLTITKYSNDKLVGTKQLVDYCLNDVQEYNGNYYLVGISNNNIIVYVIDKNLKVIKKEETHYLVDSEKYKIYFNGDKVYIFGVNYGLLDKDVLVMNSNYEISFVSYSSIDINTLKDVLKSDYYLYLLNGETDNWDTCYYYSVSNKDYVYLVGEDDEGALLTILDKNGNEVKSIKNEKYNYFRTVDIINGRLVITGLILDDDTWEKENYIVEYDLEGNKISETNMNSDYNVYGYTKLCNKIVFILNSKNEKLVPKSWDPNYGLALTYDYDIKVNYEVNPLGTIEVNKDANYNERVNMNIVPNSGYIVSSLSVYDEYGNMIEVNDNSFKMPNSSVYIDVVYSEEIVNPNTVDIIVFISLGAILGLGTVVYFGKKYAWLR